MTRPPQWNRLIRSTLVCLILITSVATLTGIGTVAAQTPDVVASPNGLVINEVFNSQTPGLEYFELYNTSAVSINLSTYALYNNDQPEGGATLSSLSDPIIGPGEIRAIGPSQLGRPTLVGPTGLARTDFLALVVISPTDTTIDVVNFGGPPLLSWRNYDKFRPYFFPTNEQPDLPEDTVRSIQRWPDGLDTNSGRDWQLILRSPSEFSCADPAEGVSDDNSLQAAVLQTANTTVKHRICGQGDTDFVAISMSSSFTYTLRAVADGTNVDTGIRLYDPSNVLVAQDNPAGTRDSTINFRPTTSGTFRVQIFDANGGGGVGPTWLYNFSIAESSAATATPVVGATATPISCNDRYEPDNSLQEAGNIDLNTEQVHTLCRRETTDPDTDWIRFSVNGGKVYSLYTKDLSGPVDTIITLFDAAGNRLDENDDYQPGSGLASRIDYTFGGTGVYFLRIRDKRGLNGAGYQYTAGFSSTGALPPTGTPTASPTTNPNSPTPTTGPCTDSYEPDGVADTARTLLIGSSQQHSICPVTDADWVRFYARAGKVYTIRTSSLGIGLDTYMYLFDSNAETILAQNDDGGGEGVASRIDFYPQRDDWYFAQVKNAGDLGLPEMTYELSLAVVPGVPQPPGTATGIIAPVVTVTSAPGGAATPTTVVQPTRPPVPSPTQGVVQPTPEAAQTATSAVPVPVGTAEKPPVPTQAPPTQTPAPPTVEAVAPTVAPEPTQPVPGVPNTGALPANNAAVANDPVIVVGAPVQPEQPVRDQLAPMLFRVFYDLNKNDSFNKGEGIPGIDVYFLDATNNLAPTGSLKTSGTGEAGARMPIGPQRVYIPYLAINMPLTRFPERELHSIWLHPVELPDRLP
ncbi:MAG: pre-peptidase C-terminal domain-containing protein [Chloroflexota bacterium]